MLIFAENSISDYSDFCPGDYETSATFRPATFRLFASDSSDFWTFSQKNPGEKTIKNYMGKSTKNGSKMGKLQEFGKNGNIWDEFKGAKIQNCTTKHGAARARTSRFYWVVNVPLRVQAKIA